MSGEDIGDLYDDFMSLINQGYYNKNESDEKYLKNLEVNLEGNGKLYIVDTPQGSLELINDYLDPEIDDVIILKGVLKDIEDDPISHVKMNLVENNEIIDTGVTDNNGVVEYSYGVTDEQEHSLKALTRYSESNSEIVKGVPHVFEIPFTVDNAPIGKFPQMFRRVSTSRLTTVDGSNNFYVDWGDGSELETIDKKVGSTQGHYYSVNGEYVMKIYNVNCPSTIFASDTDLNGLSIKSPMITCSAFMGAKFKKIVLSNKIKNLPNATCSGCTNLKEIVLPSKLESMGASIFAGCSELESIDLPNTLKSMGSGAFAVCSKLKTIELPSNLETMSSSVFTASGIINVDIPRSVITFGNGMFATCDSLKFVVFNWIGDEIITFGNGYGTDGWSLGNSAIIIPDNSMSDYVAKNYPVNNLYEQGATLTLTSNKQELTEDEEVTLTATLINNGNVESKNVTFEIYNGGEIIESLTATTDSSGVATTTYTVIDDVIIKSTVAGGGIESNTVSITFPKQLLDIKFFNPKRGVTNSNLYSIDDEFVTGIRGDGESSILDIPYGEYTIKIESKSAMGMMVPQVIKVLKNPFVYNRLNYQFEFNDDDFEEV